MLSIIKEWFCSKHFYNNRIDYILTDDNLTNFSNNISKKYNFISNIELLKYFTNLHSLKNLDEEKTFGQNIYKYITNCDSPPSNWSTKLSEHFAKECLEYIFDEEIKFPKNDKKFNKRLDLFLDNNDFKNYFEIKCRTYFTSGTAGEKILSVPKKYAKFLSNKKIPLNIILLGYQEIEANKFSLFDMEKEDNYDIQQLELWNKQNIRFIKGSDIIKIMLIKHKNDIDGEKIIKTSFEKKNVEKDLKKEKEIINMVKYTPFIKWVGGKTQILDNVLDKFPKKINNYHEIFIGGGSVLLGLISEIESNNIKLEGKIYAYDINNNLITTYNMIKTKPKKLIKQLAKITKKYNNIEEIKGPRDVTNEKDSIKSKETYYYYIRYCFNKLIKEENPDTIMVACYMIFLNKTCFRGLYRMGPNGFNVPFGNYKNPTIYDTDKLMELSKVFKNVEFMVLSFEDSLKIKKFNKNDFIYLDPPYVPEKAKSFTKYNEDDFTLEKHNLLFKKCHQLKEKNIKFIMSNSCTKLVEDSFKNYKIEKILCKRTINSKNPEAKTKEVLIYN